MNELWVAPHEGFFSRKAGQRVAIRFRPDAALQKKSPHTVQLHGGSLDCSAGSAS